MLPNHLTTHDGLQLQVRHWTLDNPKGVVVIVHGLAEHIERYAHVGAALNAAGYAAVGLDHRGHGHSQGEPRVYVTEMQTYVDDLYQLWAAAKAAYPDKPLFMLGHSMGGQIATLFALRYQQEMRGLVTTSIGLLPGESISPFLVKVGKVIAKLSPQLPLTALESATVSRDPAVVANYDSDPLNYRGKVRAGMGAALITGGEKVLAEAHRLTLPLLILHGEQDQLVPNRASQLFHAGVGSADKTLKIYPQLYHEIMNEPEQAQVLAEIVAWLDAHLA